MATDTINVVYTSGINLTYISVTSGMNLQDILYNINAAVNSMSPAPDYTGYALGCLRDDYTITDTQQFAEAVADFVCTQKATLDNFLSVTYPNDSALFASILDGVVNPALIYSPFSIIDTDSITQVWTKVFAGFDGILTNLDVTGADWADISLSPPSSLTEACNIFISQFVSIISTLTTWFDPINALISPYDNTDCLGGGALDDARTTIDLIKTYICTLPSYTSSDLDWTGCVPQGGTLEDDIQSILDVISAGGSLVLGGVTGDGFIVTPGGTCASNTLSIDTTWPGYYMVMSNLFDSSPGFLENKIVSGDASVTISVDMSGNLDLSVPANSDHKVAVNSVGAMNSIYGYLQELIPSTEGDWGIGLSSVPSPDNKRLILTPNIIEPNLLVESILDLISTDPELLAKFCALRTACDGCLCAVVDDLIVTISTTDFVLNWTHTGGTTSSQIAKYRPGNIATWLTGNFTPANILSNSADTTTASGLNLNTLYQFQIDSNCAGDVSHSALYESIIYSCQDLESTVDGTIISVTQDPVDTISTIQYRLRESSGGTIVDNQETIGISPNVSFVSQISGDYTVEWRYGTLVNGVTLYSDDATQVGDWCISETITIP